MPDFDTKYIKSSYLLLPNRSIEKNLEKNTKFFLNKALQQLNILGEDLNDSALRMDLRRNYSAIFSPYAEKLAEKYGSEQDRYTKTVVNNILTNVYNNAEEVQTKETDDSKNYLLLLGLIPFMFDVLDEALTTDVSIEAALVLTKEKTLKKIETMTNEMNYNDFLSVAQESLINKGITRAVWTSHDVGQHIRPSHHFIMNGEEYDLIDGMYDPDYGDYVQCGELNGCRCTPRILLRM